MKTKRGYWQAGFQWPDGKPVLRKAEAERVAHHLVSVIASVDAQDDSHLTGVWLTQLTTTQVRALKKKGYLELVGRIGSITVEMP